MNSSELRDKFLKFFEKRGHKIVPSSSLLPSDKSVLFTTAGMQQFKEYYLGKPSPYGNNACSCQKCVRTSDIEEVGDESHLTFFEMLGNFSFGGYFKEEAIKLAYDFIIKELKLDIDYVTIFSPDKIDKNDWRKSVLEDKESHKIWKNLGIAEDNIKKEGADNFWGPTGNEGPCGPTTEIYIKTKSGKSIEIWNIVFNQYFCDSEKKLKELEAFGVDTGMGLERLAMAIQDKETVFETDSFEPIIEEIEKQSGLKYNANPQFRVIADHIKSAVFLASDGVLPSNIEQGYILRRLIRRSIRYGNILKIPNNFIPGIIEKVIEVYREVYTELENNKKEILNILQEEENKFEKTLERGLKEISKFSHITGEKMFNIYETYGLPLEVAEEIVKVENRDNFFKALKKHQEISRAGAEKKFGGVGKEADNYNAVKLHTATHLLHKALREVLGEEVHQMGSDINAERLRFDFSYAQKMTPDQIEKVENIVNQKIKEDLEVKKEEMPYKEAVGKGALAFFKEKYPEIVSVYSAGSFSKEICAGPHAKRTSELGVFDIIKEESSSAGVRRIKAVLK